MGCKNKLVSCPTTGCEAVLRCGRKTTCLSQASQLQVSWCDIESAHDRLSALRPQSALLIVLRQQHGWSLPSVPSRTAGSLKLFIQTASQRKTGENHHEKQVSGTKGVPLTAVIYSLLSDQLTVVALLQDLCTNAVPQRRSLKGNITSLDCQTSVIYSFSCSKSGTLTTMPCLAMLK